VIKVKLVDLKGLAILDIRLSGMFLSQSATEPQNSNQSESKKTHVVSINE